MPCLQQLFSSYHQLKRLIRMLSFIPLNSVLWQLQMFVQLSHCIQFLKVQKVNNDFFYRFIYSFVKLKSIYSPLIHMNARIDSYFIIKNNQRIATLQIYFLVSLFWPLCSRLCYIMWIFQGLRKRWTTHWFCRRLCDSQTCSKMYNEA